jgi:hypothetical protein
MLARKAASPATATTVRRARDVNRRAAPITSDAKAIAVRVQVVRHLPLGFVEDCFVARCVARSSLVRSGDMELLEAVDGLQQAAGAYGLIEHHGQDAVQAVMAEAFAWRQPQHE